MLFAFLEYFIRIIGKTVVIVVIYKFLNVEPLLHSSLLFIESLSYGILFPLNLRRSNLLKYYKTLSREHY